MTSSLDCAGVVLAGGASSRFERGDKALAEIGGTPLVARVVEQLRLVAADGVVVAVRTPEQERGVADALEDAGATARIVRDADGHEGPLAGIRASLERVTADRFGLVACDMPLFEPGMFEWLSARDPAADAVVPTAGCPQPMQAVYRTAAVESALDDLPRTGGLFALLDALESVAFAPVSDAPPSLPAERSLTNVNTVSDLRTAAAAGDGK